MVAGKTNPGALAKAAGPPKLPPLHKLRVRKPDQADANPCLGVMSSVLGMRHVKSWQTMRGVRAGHGHSHVRR